MEAINRVGNFTISLIDDSNIKIKKARANHVNTDFTKDLILIDTLGSALKSGTSDSFDGVNESMKFNDYFIQVFTFDFYGSNAYTLANQFRAKLRSQRSYDLQRSSGLSFKRTSNLENLKQLNGTIWQERYQMEISVGYYDSYEIDTLRIDTLNATYLFDE